MATYDRMQVKASHNSYSRRRGLSLAAQLSGDPAVPGSQSCRGIELDIVQAPSALQWQVRHGSSYDSDDPEARPLSAWLGELRRWSEEHPGHPVLTLHLDMKNAPPGLALGEYAAGLDDYVARALGRDRIYGPCDMIGGAPDLVTAARLGGWPDESFLVGKVVVCLSGRPKRKVHYAEFEPGRRLCFTDRSWARWNRSPPTSGHWVFLNVLVVNRAPDWIDVRPFLDRRGFIVRGFNIVNPGRWDEARREGLHILSTDALRDPRFVL